MPSIARLIRPKGFAALNRLASFALVLALSLCLTAPADAQGTSGQVPDPMSSAELSHLMNMYVHPSKEQTASIEKLHDSYRDRFRLLRENEIERFLTKMKGLQGGVPKKAQMEDFTRSYERVNKQIAEVDDSFFEGVATLMGEERRPAVQRAREARARTRYSAGMMSGMQALYPSVDLSAIVLEMGLTPAELATLDPMLVSYEQSLTAALKDLGAASTRMITDMVDEMEKAGLADMSQEDMIKDPEKMKQVMETIQSAMAKAGERFKEKSIKLGELNSKTCQSLMGQLAGDSQRKLRSQYVAKAYPQLAGDPAGANAVFKRVLASKKIDDAVREQIRGEYRQWQDADDAFVAQGIKDIDAERTERSLMDFGGGVERGKKMGERLRQRMELASKSLQSASALVEDPKLKKLFKSRKGDQAADDADEMADDDQEAPPAEIGARAAAPEARGPFGEVIMDRGPMSDEIITGIETQLALDNSGKALLKTMYEDYSKKWDEEIRPEQARVDGLNGGRWTQGANAKGSGPGTPSLDSKKQDEYFNSRKELLTKATAADDAFLNDLASTLGDKAAATLQMAKLERMLDRTAGGGMFGGMAAAFGAPEAQVNIVAVLREAKLSPQEQAKVNEVLVAQVDPLAKLLLESTSASMDLDRELEEMSIRNAVVFNNPDGEKPDMAAMQKLGMEMMAIQSRQGEVKAKRSEALRTAWAAAIAPLSEAQQSSLQLAFDQRAYPAIFKDSRSAIPYIEKALALHDLSTPQRQQLQQLLDTTRTEHVEFCRKMLPKRNAGPPPTKPEEMGPYWQEQMAIANAREKIRFERDENSQRAVSSLRRILDEDQAKQIAGIEDYEKVAAKKKTNPFGVE